MSEKKLEGYTKFEIARIIGARALQIAMDAPILYDIPKDKLEQIEYDPIKIAEIEFNAGILPISVKRPMPKKGQEKIKPIDESKIKEQELREEKKVEHLEKVEETGVKEGGEIMELARPEDEEEVEEKEEEGE